MDDEILKERRLDERETSILRGIIHEYITTGKPVGSRSFVQKYSLSLSAATMRNIMYDLEGMQYLSQPHTSAGRVPNEKGYRFYIDTLLDSYNFTLHDKANVSEDILNRELQLDKIFLYITRMLSNESNYASIIITPSTDFAVVKRIVLVSLDEGEILFVLVTRTGRVINRKVVIRSNVTQDDLHNYSIYLTNGLAGYTLYELKEKIFDDLMEENVSGINKEIALDIAQLAINEDDKPELYIEGIENLLKIPEMIEEERLQSLLYIIEEKDLLRKVLELSMKKSGINVLIGNEIENPRVIGCSMVSTSYKIGNKTVGSVGVLGPTRMDYEKVVPLVDYTGRVISDLLTKMSK